MTSVPVHFDKLSMYDRASEPVSLSFPFAEGQLADPAVFQLRNGDAAIPAQTSVTARWPDGSIKWLLAHFLVDLPGNTSHDIEAVWDSPAPSGPPNSGVSASASEEGVTIDTGLLKVLVSKQGFGLFKSVVHDGSEWFGPGDFSGFWFVDDAGNRFSTGAANLDSIEVLESGPVRAQVECMGTHVGETGACLDFRVEVVAWAGRPWIDVDYQFINRESGESVTLSEIGLTLSAEASGEIRCAIGEGHYRTTINEGPGESLLDGERILYQAVEHDLATFYGDFWADWRDSEKGVAITQHQAHQNFPKSLKVDDTGIHVGIYPASQTPIEILQGVAKTHRFQFNFHNPDTPLDEICVRSLQYQFPDIAVLPEACYRDAGVWNDLFPRHRCQGIEQQIIDMADGRGRSLGLLHWGDTPDANYTQQGRGKGDIVWTNNEYDSPHAFLLLYAKTGERRFRDAALVAARHWMDIDICHFSDDPLRMGGQIVHSARHVTAGVTPSHEWTEGLLDVYHITGCREARDKAIAIADNMLRHLAQPKFSTPGAFAARETGWAMHGLIAVHQETGGTRYLEACHRIADQFIDWRAEHGAFLSPYTSHTMIRVPFMTSIAVNALYRYYGATNDDRIPRLIVDEMGDLLDNCVMPDGRFVYKELPSLHHRADYPLQMEALAHAYTLSGEDRFLDHVLLMMRARIREGSRRGRGGKRIYQDAVLFEGQSSKDFAFSYVSIMAAYKMLSDAGKIDELNG